VLCQGRDLVFGLLRGLPPTCHWHSSLTARRLRCCCLRSPLALHCRGIYTPVC
jgi:hypothetical protein